MKHVKIPFCSGVLALSGSSVQQLMTLEASPLRTRARLCRFAHKELVRLACPRTGGTATAAPPDSNGRCISTLEGSPICLRGHSVIPNYSENYGDILAYVKKKLYLCANSSWEVRLSDVRY